MAIESKTVYVSNDGSYWNTEEEAIVRNEEIAAEEASKIAKILNTVNFGSTTISTRVESFEISKPDEFTKVEELSQISSALSSNNVIRLDGVTKEIYDLAVEYNVNSTILELMSKVHSSGITFGTFYKVNKVWYSSNELASMATNFIVSVRTVDTTY